MACTWRQQLQDSFAPTASLTVNPLFRQVMLPNWHRLTTQLKRLMPLHDIKHGVRNIIYSVLAMLIKRMGL